MAKIVCKLFGSASCFENGKQVALPPGKVSGVFYYCLFKKSVTRTELVDLFWPYANDEHGKTSLRNALHKIRTMFESEVFFSPNKYTVCLNVNNNYYVDALEFERDPHGKINLHDGEFLKDLHLKDLAEFDDWVTEKRNYYQNLYVETMQKKIEQSFAQGHTIDLEKDITALLSIDNYNDMAYLYLMRVYRESGRNDKIINEYHKLQQLYQEDLGIDPPDEITAIYKEAVGKINTKRTADAPIREMLYNREFELKLLQDNFDAFLQGAPFTSVVIRGDVGTGKTMVKNELLARNAQRCKFFEVYCYSVEKEFSYSPWVKMISLLDKELSLHTQKKPTLWDEAVKGLFFYGSHDRKVTNILENREKYNPDLLYGIIIKALQEIGKTEKVVLILEDIQWADVLSAKLLINLILHLEEDVCMIATKSNENEELDRQLSTLKELNKLTLLNLNCLNKQDVGRIVRKTVTDKPITQKDIDSIYEKSQGNPFFVKEYIALFQKNDKESFMTTKMYDVVEGKFSGLGDDEMTMLRIISVFNGDASVDTLMKIVNISAYDAIKYLHMFVEHNILQEINTENHVYVRFAHSAYKDYIYSKLKLSTRRLINKLIAQTLETELVSDNKDITNYVRLEYHYKQANESVKSLKYEVYILNYYLSFNHEVFPNLSDYDMSKQVKLSISNERVMRWMEDLEQKLYRVRNSKDSALSLDEINEVELLFLYCKGRYLIRGGSYTSGVKAMNRVIRQANAVGDGKTEIFGHKQMVIYGIQINNCSIMLKHIISAIKAAKEIGDNSEIAVLYRLYGVYHMMRGSLDKAEGFFERSLSIFMDTEHHIPNSSISIAANYNYIGEIRNADADYEQAMIYYNKAIQLCIDSGATCLALFYINAGKACYFTGDYEKMHAYLTDAKAVVSEFDSYWKNPVLDALLALYHFIHQQYNRAMDSLKIAVIEVKTINNTRDIGMVYFVQTIISKRLLTITDVQSNGLKQFLDEPMEMYYYKALKYLDPVRDRAEINEIKKIVED